MATTIITKNGSGAPVAGDLVQGELAVDLTNKTLYSKDSSGNVFKVGDTGGGSPGTFTDLVATNSFTSPGIDDNATSTAITIDANENVGIGVSSMDNPLHVRVTPNTASKISGSAFDGGALRIDGNLANAGDESAILGGASDGLSAGIGFMRESGSTWGTALKFYTHSPSITTTDELTEAMRIDALGNVGIGEASPNAKLVIKSDANDEYAIRAGNAAGDSGGLVGVTKIGLDAGTSGATHAGVYVGIEQSSASGYKGDLTFATRRTNSDVEPTEAMRIDASGNVGIGGTPGTREAGEYLERAKTRIAGWKTTFDARLKAEPEASTQDITLEVTDGDFSVFPTAEALAEKMAERAIGDGTAKLQVNGDGYFSGALSATGNSVIGASASDTPVDLRIRTTLSYNNSSEASITLGPSVGPVANGRAFKWRIASGGSESGHSLRFYKTVAPSNDESLGMHIDSSSNLHVNGNVTAYSDERLKSDVETLDGSKVYDMRGVSFTKDGEAGSGVIAQELQKVAPELVHEGEEYLSVAYGNLVGYLIEAVKDLKAEVEELKRAK